MARDGKQVESFGQLHAAFAHCRAGDAVPAGDVGHRAAGVGKAGGEREALQAEASVAFREQLADEAAREPATRQG